MMDGIIKADGTSRLMRATLPATYEEFKAQAANGTLPLDVLFNEAGWSQLPTFLNKANLLKDTTANVFGLGSDAVPNDVFRVMSRFQSNLGNEYVWAKIGKTVSLGAAKSDKAIFVAKTLYYSDSIDDSGQLVNPQIGDMITGSAIIATLKELTGKYFYFTGSASTTMATIFPDNTVFYMESCNPAVIGSTETMLYSGAVYRSVSVIVDTTYVNSPYADTYPPAVSDGYTYAALGRLGNKVQIATGSYTGTGTYGASNPNSLTFDFVPKAVIVHGYAGGGPGSVTMLYGSTHLYDSFYSDYLSVYFTISWSEKTVSWYGDTAEKQMNKSGYTYLYFAIG